MSPGLKSANAAARKDPRRSRGPVRIMSTFELWMCWPPVYLVRYRCVREMQIMKVVKEDEEGFMCPAWRRRGTEGEEFGYSSSKGLALCKE